MKHYLALVTVLFLGHVILTDSFIPLNSKRRVGNSCRIDEYIGNTPEFNTYEFIQNGIVSKMLYVPLFFWFCNTSGLALPLLCLEYASVRINIQLNKLYYISINYYLK
jgi:hypothetical protein